MIPDSLYAIRWHDDKRGGSGLERSFYGPHCIRVWPTREEAEHYIEHSHLSVEQRCEVVEYRRVP